MGAAVVVDRLSKRYSLGSGGGYRRLTETLHDLVRPRSRPDRSADELWALRDVSFEVAEGEVVGIIGRNGAGKSTLLKILSRITEPTSGRAELRGRVGSLLEVGTGFHPELTGRENIFLNGAVLGMRRAEIEARFDEIVAFAEIDRFLDTPVKRYSSGMYVRLAFAVAAHLEPEILVVDEVLAVGDVAFQKKCLGKMDDVAKSGRTVLFVSHNMAAVSAMCTRGILLSQGTIEIDATAGDAVSAYLRGSAEVASKPLSDRHDRTGSGAARIAGVTLASSTGSTIRSDSALTITLQYSSSVDARSFVFAVGIFDEFGSEVYCLDSEVVGGFDRVLPSEGSVTVVTSPLNMTPGRCYLNVAIVAGGLADSGELFDRVEQALLFDVEAIDMFGTGRTRSREWSLCILGQQWSVADSAPAVPTCPPVRGQKDT